MAFPRTILLAAAPVLVAAQAVGLSQQSTAEDLKAVRSSLERLERGQAQLVALIRIQIDESRLTALEAQQQRLLALEQSLAAQISLSAANPRGEDVASGPRLVQALPGGEPVIRNEPSPVATRGAEASRKLEEVRRNLRTVEKSMAVLKERISVWEKQLEAISR